MSDLNLQQLMPAHQQILARSFVAAAVIEFLVLTILGWQHHWLAHPQTVGLDATKFLEAQVYELPKDVHLTEQVGKRPAPSAAPEKKISTHPSTATPAPAANATPEEQNQTQGAPQFPANHGPVAVVAPPPVIPGYLRESEINATVVIEFLVNSLGTATPRLIGSSGNDELDAIALKTVKAWQFRPAEQNHQAIDAKVRLRIQFEVH